MELPGYQFLQIIFYVLFLPEVNKQRSLLFRLYYALLFCFHNFEEDTKLKSCTEATSILNAHDNTVCARNCGTLQNCIYLRIPRWYHKYVVPFVDERFKHYEVLEKLDWATMYIYFLDKGGFLLLS